MVFRVMTGLTWVKEPERRCAPKIKFVLPRELALLPSPACGRGVGAARVGRGLGVGHNTLSRPAGTLGFGILRRPTSCIHAVVSQRERVISFGPSGRF
ncbi:MAG: hypothetical protein DI524_15215 [Ectopseudomonas oleovorans]|nr:MAG: hypothetical protein DI524_15215 [Pseudomonas oleovorans]